ncbi:hypothetical protein HK405_002508, partial [Cladochytrium tenue]
MKLIENASLDSGIPRENRTIDDAFWRPTPGRLATVKFNNNTGCEDGDAREPTVRVPDLDMGALPSDRTLNGRAVLIVASGDRELKLAAASARALRRTGSTLPIEVWASASTEAFETAASAI